MHLFVLAYLIFGKTFEAQDFSGIATLENKGYSYDAQFHHKINNNHLFEQITFSGVKKLQSGTSTVIYTFLGFHNSTVGLKNVAIEYLSSPLMLIAEYSTLMMDSCISHQKSTSPFLLQSGSISIVNLTLIPQISFCSRSLVFSSDDSNSVVLRNSIMADLAVSSSECFLLSGKSKSEEISNCAFRNMSEKYDKNSDYQISHSCLLSSMENCLVYSCVNAFEGGISSGSYSSHDFICRNISISFGKRETNALQKKEQMNTTESQTFSLCEWTDCTAEQGGALYIHNNENAILTVENSSFTRCSASSTRGGGIYALKVAECIVKHSTFVQCSAAATPNIGGGGIMIENVYIQPIVDNCFFQSCSSGDDGGAIVLCPTNTQRQKHCISNSFFDNCRCNGSAHGAGGAIMHWDCIDKVMISNCLLCDCYSMHAGGAIGLLINSYNRGTLLFFCFFHDNICVKGGHDIVLYNSTENNIDPSCYSTRQTMNRVSTDTASTVDRSDWLHNDFGNVRFVSSTDSQPKGNDTYACGINESHPCGTISRCLTQLISGYVTEIEVFSGTIIETNSFDCGSDSFTVYGQSNMSATIHTEFEASGLSLFSVSTGTLTISDLIFVHDSAHPNNRGSRLFEISGAGEMHVNRLNISIGSGQSTETAFTTELINVQNGMLQMDNVNWAKTISTVSLFSLSSTNEISLKLSECTFDGIERTTSGAAVISITDDKANIDLNSCIFEGCGSTTSTDGGSMMLCAGEGNEVKVKGGSFDGCYCSETDGLGGGILLRLLNENPDFLISSSFGTNTAKWGNDIFVISPNLEETAKSENITCVTASLDSVDKVRGYDNGNASVAIPLCIYLLPTPEEIHVSYTEASNHSHCGIAKFPCLTLKHSLTRLTGTKKIIVNGMILMSDELAFDEQKHEIRGNDDQSGWIVSDIEIESDAAMIATNVETVLSKLIFSLPSSLPLHQTFISSSSQLTLSHCSISLQYPSSELACLFLSVDSGSLVIDFFSVLSITLSTTPLISFSGSSSYTESMSIKWLNMTNCTFTEIERAAGSGGCVSIGNSHDDYTNTQINIEESVFDGCSVLADGSRGGAIDVQMKGNIQMNIISCTFTGCTAPAGEEEKTGFGGGMALKLIDDGSSFVISSPVFDTEKPNTARYGNNLFVESSNLTKSITNDTLPFVSENLVNISLDSMRGFDGGDTTNAIPLVYFWLTLGSEVFIGGDGKDMGACGFSDYPCISVDYSLTRLSEGNEKNMNIIGKAILQNCVDLCGISIKSDDNNKCVLECLSSLEGAEEAAMKISGITNFELINFVIPSSFSGGVSYLMFVGSSEGLLTVKDCSFTKMEESGEEIINYGLIEADGGTVVIKFVSMQLLSFSHDVISVLSTTILNIYNLTMKNIELDGSSGLSISKSSRREKNEVEQDIVIEWSLFEEVTQNRTNDVPIIRNDNDEPLKMVIRNTTMKRCGGLKCGKGGGMFCVLNEGGSFDCSFCTISECFCSTTGRGGWLFLECSSVAEKPLSFVLSNLTFKDNSALRGRDVYVRCHSIETQIVDEQFLLDFRAPFVKELAMWGCSTDSFEGEEDLLLRVVKYQSETIFVSSVSDNHEDNKRCGEFSTPCQSLNVGIQHIIPSSYSQLLISKETIINGECEAKDVIVRSLQSSSAAQVHLKSTITGDSGNLFTTSENIRFERLKFNFRKSFSYSGSFLIHEASGQLSLSFVDFSSVGGSNNNQPAVALNSSLLSIESGILHVDNCSVSLLSFKEPSFLLSGEEISLTNVKLEQIESTADVFEIGSCGSVAFNGVSADGVKLPDGCIISIDSSSSGTISVGSSSFDNCSRNSEGASVLSSSSTSAHIVLSNCSCSICDSLSSKGSIVEINNAKDVFMDSCQFIGVLSKENENERNNAFEEICEWNGSLIYSANSSLVMKYVTIMNASSGGFSASTCDVTIEKGEFLNNNPFIEKYPSLHRNIICSDSGVLNVMSLKGGDGLKENSSLWILNEGCTLGGVVSERDSSFFIPMLESVSSEEDEREIKLTFTGSLLLPCNLSFEIISKVGDVDVIDRYELCSDEHGNESSAVGRIPSSVVKSAAEEAEVSVCILFGKADSPSSTQSFILKNRSEPKDNGDVKLVEGGKEGKSYWLLIVIVLVVLFLIVLIVAIAFIVRWKKQKRRTKELEVIVEDTVKKDPKVFEMVTMEMSPEEQWRRAEREAEKKNEERIKKRVYETNMEHSESSEHLLSESGSTEYILGRDSDKIPEWMLEKVEEEEIRKQTPSPSISSTSTTSTTDSDSTFVRGEDLCPTTSSMSNLVDAMSCSSPHEKLIVDLRDSLFMLLHGLNKTKEMAIGSLQEREQTAAQILFWVANGALHSFDEMENKLQSLSSLSPHIVLFSEHMVICIVMHSDLLSDDDSDSSSISSLSIVSSSSNISLMSERFTDSPPPSSAFEDDEGFKKECLRWKAPELIINKKMGATKESVAFSIGMMLWECLTLQVPFGEYEAVIVGEKIVNGERPKLELAEESGLFGVMQSCLSAKVEGRPTLIELKRTFFRQFPDEAMVMTMTDALCCEGSEESKEKGRQTRDSHLLQRS
ncbi:uncharacterized protein MONOS_91 [Monocercomonoides exilis]|uniref:uncharacterized protein n=1 Tax=Monocercomonoides exilis TaxID=2049356 RepID=UPI003559F5A1|nr:hypothetical protein MONOS_91 [Monocercomonoides exilis]|eukprot:MONOS_91.1-p1 / transcript=MONOS_91.1 / gene=MONOS_91 / organism=Monocercomonoides_exilis_PA203 / gene_product=unspecified product / transcript_product=unspecified product / location=Mono_scaffold00002:43121-50896(-) / protein_length=2574 / sequence_SO=supercontig / SO=protein_coding / is_pseudo=false